MTVHKPTIMLINHAPLRSHTSSMLLELGTCSKVILNSISEPVAAEVNVVTKLFVGDITMDDNQFINCCMVFFLTKIATLLGWLKDKDFESLNVTLIVLIRATSRRCKCSPLRIGIGSLSVNYSTISVFQ